MKTPHARKLSLTVVQRTAIAELIPDLSSSLLLDEPYRRTILFSDTDLEDIRAQVEASLPQEKSRTRQNVLRRISAMITETLHEKKANDVSAVSQAYQFTITLLDIEPPIWRQILIKDCSLSRLHSHIQTAMGWTNSHLYQFDIDGEIYQDTPPMMGDFGDFRTRNPNSTKISQIIPDVEQPFAFLYEYDLGDSWAHEILFERYLPVDKKQRYPACIAGARACPPEDVGGVWGYMDFLEAQSDPQHEMHEEMMEWAGPFDAEAFDKQQTSRAMRRGLPNWS